MNIIFIENKNLDTTWYIDHGPFYDRFKEAKTDILMSTNAVVTAILKDLSSRKWVDLKLPVVAASLNIISGIIPSLTLTLITAILNSPVSPEENFALRKIYFS